MNAFDAQIKIGVVGLSDVQALEARVKSLQKTVNKNVRIRVDAEGQERIVERLVVSLERVNIAATKANRALNSVDVNSWIQLRQGVETYVDALEQQLSVQQKINRAIDEEINKRRGINPAQYSRPAGPGNAVGENAFRNRQRQDAAVEARALTFEQRLQAVRKRNADQLLREQEARRLASEQRVQTARRRIGESIGSGLIGGAFPALFGQGGAVALGGGIGGLAGGLLGGAGGFAGGIVGSAIGLQLENITGALKKPTEAIDLLTAAGVKLDAKTLELIDSYNESGDALAAQRIAYEQLVETFGQDAVNKFIEADKAVQELSDNAGELTRELLVGLTPVIRGLAEAASDAVPFLRDFFQTLQQNRQESEIRGQAANETVRQFGVLGSLSLEARGFQSELENRLRANAEFNERAASQEIAKPSEITAQEQLRAAQQRQKADEKAAREREQQAKRLAELQQRYAEQLYRNQVDLQRAQFDAETSLLNRRIEITERLIRAEEEVIALRTNAGVARDQVSLLFELFAGLRGNRDELEGFNRELQGAQMRLQQLQQAPPAMMPNPMTGMGGAAGGQQAISSLVSLAQGAGFRGDSAAIMAAIAMAESSGNPRAHNPRPPDNSYGLWQINMLGAMGPERRRQFGIGNNEQLFDPRINARAAAQIYQSQGFNAWSVYKSGAYRQFLPAARQALGSGGPDMPMQIPVDSFVPDQVGQLQQQGQIEQQAAAVAGLRQELAALQDVLPVLDELDLERYLERTTNVFADQATQISENSQALMDRNRLLMEGMRPEQADLQVRLNEIDRQAADRLGAVANDEVISQLRSSGAPEELVSAVVKATEEVIRRSAQQLKDAEEARFANQETARGLEVFRQQSQGLQDTNAELSLLIGALSEGRDGLSEVEEAILRYGDAWQIATQQQRESIIALAQQKEALRNQLEDLRELREFSQDLGGTISESLIGGLAGIVTGTRTIEQAFADMFAGIADAFLQQAQRMLREYLSNQIFSGLFSLLGGGLGAFSGPSFSAAAPDLLGGFFGGASPLPSSVLPGLATGGPASAGKPYLVGEEGPELFIPGISGRVLSANETADYLTDAEIRALEGAAEAADGSTGIGGNSTTNVDARRTSNRSDTSQRFDSSSASSYVQQQARSIAAAAGGNGASSSTSSESSLFSDTRAMINTANAVMQQRESESSIMEAVRSDSEQGRSVTVEWRKVGDLDVVTREQLIGAMTQAERRGARKGKEMVLSGVKRDPSFRRQMR